MVTARLSYSDFLESCKNYHKANDPSDLAQNYVDVVNNRKVWDNLESLTINIVEREMFGKYLFDWGKMNRCFPKSHRGVCYALLQETIVDATDTIESLRGTRIEKVSLEAYKEEIETLYRMFRDFCHKEVKRQPTASAKILHILLPRPFIIWDQKYVRSKLGLGDDPASYVRYLAREQSQLEELLISYRHANPSAGLSELVEDAEAEHHKFLVQERRLKEPAQEPITKLLDEYQVVHQA